MENSLSLSLVGGVVTAVFFLLAGVVAVYPATFAINNHSTVPEPVHSRDGPNLACYYTPTSYFSPSQVPSQACTHLIYAFGSLDDSALSITNPSAQQASAWTTLTSLRRQNPELKVMLSLQQGFPGVVGSDVGKMQQFAANSVTYLRTYQLDGVDMDWEFPSAAQRSAFAKFFTIMRTTIDKEAHATGKPALLLSLALPNNQIVASKSYDLSTISSAVDFGTAMAYDFHLYGPSDRTTGYNSPLYTPPGEQKYSSAVALAKYYLSQGMPAQKLFLGIPTYGRSWQLANASSHALHAPAVGKGVPGPYRHLSGIYTYPDACVALQQLGATSVPDSSLGAVYLFKDTTWVAYDDPTTVSAKSNWAMTEQLGGLGVWAMHLDDIDGICGAGSLPLITAMRKAQLRWQEGHQKPLFSLTTSQRNPKALRWHSRILRFKAKKSKLEKSCLQFLMQFHSFRQHISWLMGEWKKRTSLSSSPAS